MLHLADLICGALLALGALVSLVHHAEAQSQPQPPRVDTYDKNSNRTGYATVDPRTGRIDFYDVNSNRTGSGTITPAPASAPSWSTTPPSPQPPVKREHRHGAVTG